LNVCLTNILPLGIIVLYWDSLRQAVHGSGARAAAVNHRRQIETFFEVMIEITQMRIAHHGSNFLNREIAGRQQLAGMSESHIFHVFPEADPKMCIE
jgi:hypothetical protein